MRRIVAACRIACLLLLAFGALMPETEQINPLFDSQNNSLDRHQNFFGSDSGADGMSAGSFGIQLVYRFMPQL